jgi:nicotinamidase-related amidase
MRFDSASFEIFEVLAPAPGETVIYKQRASIFHGTALHAHLNQLGVRSLIVAGETTSGCVRASVVDGYSQGYHVSVVEECCFDRSLLTHKVNLFDMHHKYADVMHIDEVLAHLGASGLERAAE